MADVTDATFTTEVVERSKTVPVVVDLWAPWCGPCKQLGPILEKVIGETGGLVELAKVNVDENQEVSKSFQVQSIPAVYAMKDGRVVDGFMGAVGEPEVVAFVQRLLDADTEVDDADTEVGDAEAAGPTGDDVEAKADGTTSPADAVAAPAVQPQPASAPPNLGSVSPVQATEATEAPLIVDAPGNTASPAAAPSAEEAAAIERELETLLLTVKTVDADRERYVALLDQLGPAHPETNNWRRKLATTLF